MTLMLASGNSHKLQEIKSILNTCGVICDIESPRSLNLEYPEPIENGSTFEMNALIKSTYYYVITSLPCIADDSGIEIEALGGSPGIHSARFSGEHGNDAENRKKVLNLLKNVEKENRKAQFKAVICLKTKSNTLYFTGICKGSISFEEKGEKGFGYDPIFIPEGYSETFAELSPEIKNQLSHRGKAVRLLAKYLMNAKF